MASAVKLYVKSNAFILNKKCFFICSKNTDDLLDECRRM